MVFTFFSQAYSDDDQSTTDFDAVTASDDEESSVVSGMSEFLNGNLGMMEHTVQQLSKQARVEDAVEEDTALDIRPENTEQAQNQLVSGICFVCNQALSRFSTRRTFPRAAERLLYLHCLFLTMVTSSRSATRVFESRIDFNFSAASYDCNQSNRSKALTHDFSIPREGKTHGD